MPLLLASDPAWRSAGAVVVGALAHLGVAFVAVNLGAVTVSLAGHSRAAIGAVFVPLAVVAWFVGRLLRRAGSFRLLFLATLGSGIGTWMATIALTVDVTARTNSPFLWASRASRRCSSLNRALRPTKSSTTS